MASNFEGKWKLESSENFDNYMKAVGECNGEHSIQRQLAAVYSFLIGYYFLARSKIRVITIGICTCPRFHFVQKTYVM